MLKSRNQHHSLWSIGSRGKGRKIAPLLEHLVWAQARTYTCTNMRRDGGSRRGNGRCRGMKTAGKEKEKTQERPVHRFSYWVSRIYLASTVFGGSGSFENTSSIYRNPVWQSSFRNGKSNFTFDVNSMPRRWIRSGSDDMRLFVSCEM